MTSTERGSSKERPRVRLHLEELEQPLERGQKPSRAGEGNSSGASSNSQSRVGHAVAPEPDGPPAHDFLDVVTRLVEMVERGRASLLEAEEARRDAELRAAGFRGEITREREIRRRTEAELQELNAMVKDLRQAASGTNDGVAAEDLDSRQQPGVPVRGRHAAPSAGVTPPPFDPDGRPLTVPGDEQADDASAPETEAGTMGATATETDDARAPGNEAGTMGATATEPDDARAPGNESDDASAEAKQSGAAVSSTLRHLDANGEAAAEEEPPLPPGWRYATDAPPPKKRWWGKSD
jgi:hypothetical protein